MGLMRKMVGTALREARRVAEEAVARRSGAGGNSGPEAGPAVWRAVGAEQARRWNRFALEVQSRWRAQEELARATAGGELLAGVWLATGEFLTEAWQRSGREFFSRWDQLLARGAPSAVEQALGEALRESWTPFEQEWHAMLERVQEMLERRRQEPGGEELRQRVLSTFKAGEARLIDAWTTAQASLKTGVRGALEAGLETGGTRAALEAAWQRFHAGIEQAWNHLLSQLEATLK